ncbi:hypothetical protein [Thalassotalea montiporae]
MAKQTHDVNGQQKSPEIANQLGQLGQLRDILFGEDKREFEAHFSNIEQSLSNQIEQLTLYVNQELKTLREETEKQIQLLNDQLLDSDHAHNERQDHIQAFVDTTADRLSNFEQQTQQTSEKIKQNAANATHQLNEQLSQEIAQLAEQFNDKLMSITSQLAHDKADRSVLANILNAAASQLNALDSVPMANENPNEAMPKNKPKTKPKTNPTASAKGKDS